MFTFIQRICVFAVAAVGLSAQSTPAAPAQVIRTSGMIGITEGQFARVNALNPGAPAPLLGVVCSASLIFWDAQGAVLKSATVSVLPGKSTFLDLFGAKDLALAGDDHREIRATISSPPFPGSPGSGCMLVGTLEVIDAFSGKTQAVIGVGHPVPSILAAAGNP